jgi:hypothetical protein
MREEEGKSCEKKETIRGGTITGVLRKTPVEEAS